VVTDKAGVYPRVLDELVPAALSTAQIRSGQPAAYDTSRSTWEVRDPRRSSPSGCPAASIATAVCERLCGSTPDHHCAMKHQPSA